MLYFVRAGARSTIAAAVATGGERGVGGEEYGCRPEVVRSAVFMGQGRITARG